MGKGTIDRRRPDGELTVVRRLIDPSESEIAATPTIPEDASLRQAREYDKGWDGSLRGLDGGASSYDTVGVPDNISDVGREEPSIAFIATGENNNVESSLVSRRVSQNTEMGRLRQLNSERDLEEASSLLFNNPMKLQLKAQILVLGDLLKGVVPSSDLLKEACSKLVEGVETKFFEPVVTQRGVQDLQCKMTKIPNVPGEFNFRNIEDELCVPGRPLTSEEPPSDEKEFLSSDDGLARERDLATSGHLMITQNNIMTARSNSNVGEEKSQAAGISGQDDDKHLNLAQASAQDALTTATSALAQSHMVWARLHSHDHSEEGATRDARIASVAATVAAAASVAKAAVEAARAIAEVSMNAFIQTGACHAVKTGASIPEFGSKNFSQSLQVTSWDQTHHSIRENATTASHPKTDIVESVVQAAGRAAEAASQAGTVLVNTNPLITASCWGGFWSRKQTEVDGEHERSEYGGMNEANEMHAVYGVDEVDGRHKVGALNLTDAVNGANDLARAGEKYVALEPEAMHAENYVFQKELNAAMDTNVHEDYKVYQNVVNHEISNDVAAANEEASAENENEDDREVAAACEGQGEVGLVNVYDDKAIVEQECEVNLVNEDQDPMAGAIDGKLTATNKGEVGFANEDQDDVCEPNKVSVVKEVDLHELAVMDIVDVPNEIAAVNEVDVSNETMEPIEEGQRINSSLEKFKRERGRCFEVPSRAKSFKELAGISSTTAPIQTVENAKQMQLYSPTGRSKDRDENVGGGKRSARHIESAPTSSSEKDATMRVSVDPGDESITREPSEKILDASVVEVMIDEVGLRGAWFLGKVIRMTPNEAFVELDDLLTENGKVKAREWFPLVQGNTPNPSRRHVRPVHPFSIVGEAGVRKQRRVSLVSQTWNISDHVDAFVHNAWWEGIVVSLNDMDATQATICFPGESKIQVVKTWNLRPSFKWKDNKWIPLKHSELLENQRPWKRQKFRDLSWELLNNGPDELVTQKSNGETSDGKILRTKLHEDRAFICELTSAQNARQSPARDQEESLTPVQQPGQKKAEVKGGEITMNCKCREET